MSGGGLPVRCVRRQFLVPSQQQEQQQVHAKDLILQLHLVHVLGDIRVVHPKEPWSLNIKKDHESRSKDVLHGGVHGTFYLLFDTIYCPYDAGSAVRPEG